MTAATTDVKATMADLRKAAADVVVITATIRENRDAVAGLVTNSNETVLSYKSLAERAEAVVAENEDELSQAISSLSQAEQKISDTSGCDNRHRNGIANCMG